MSEKSPLWIILARDYEPQMRESKTAREALAGASGLFPNGFRSAVGIVRTDLVRPGPQSRLQAVVCGIAADAAGATRGAGTFTAYLSASAIGGGKR